MGFCILTNNIDTSLVEQLNTAVSNLNTNKQNKLIDDPKNANRNFKKINGQSLLGSGADLDLQVNGKSFGSDGKVTIDIGVTKINNTAPTSGNITLKTVNNTEIVGSGNIDVGVTKIKFGSTDVSPVSGTINLVAGTNIKAFDISGNKITINGSNTAVEFTNGTLLNTIINNPNYNTFFRVQPGTVSITDFPKGFEKSEAAISLVRTDKRTTATLVTYNSSGNAKVFTRDIFYRDNKYIWLNDWTWSSAPVLIWKNSSKGTFNNRIFKESQLNFPIKYFKFLVLTFIPYKNVSPQVTFITPNEGQVWLTTSTFGSGALTYMGRVIQFNPSNPDKTIDCKGPVKGVDPGGEWPDGNWHSWYWTADDGFKKRYDNNDYMILQEIYGLTGLV